MKFESFYQQFSEICALKHNLMKQCSDQALEIYVRTFSKQY